MKHLHIPYQPEWKDTDLAAIAALMDELEPNDIAYQPWEQYLTNDTAKFAIAHTGDKLLIKYYISEKYLSARYREMNGDVHKDNCVELFIAFGDEGYYNLEFNCLGSAKIGYGADRLNRTLFTDEQINEIGQHITMDMNTGENSGPLHWTISLSIPASLFRFSDLDELRGVKALANFHKCGDDLAEPNYFAWNNIEARTPDFHQPAFFGAISFDGEELTDQAFAMSRQGHQKDLS